MKYYVFVGNNPTIICSTSDALYTFDDLSGAMGYFMNNLTNDIPSKYNYAYLVADFEIYKQPIIKATSIELYTDTLPFVIIAEYNKFSKDQFKIREDTLVLTTPGITEEFNNNAAAINKFVFLYLSKQIATLKLRYAVLVDGVTTEYESVVATTSAIYNLDKPTPIKRIKVCPILDMLPAQHIKERLFTRDEFNQLFADENPLGA